MIRNKREAVNFEKNSQNRFSFGGSDDEAGLIRFLFFWFRIHSAEWSFFRCSKSINTFRRFSPIMSQNDKKSYFYAHFLTECYRKTKEKEKFEQIFFLDFNSAKSLQKRTRTTIIDRPRMASNKKLQSLNLKRFIILYLPYLTPGASCI